MKIVCISDTHGKHNGIDLPAGDILIHAGDATMMGDIGEMERFAEWFNSRQAFDHRIFVPGNHDFCCERDMYAREPYLMNELFISQGTHYLVDKAIELDGLKFYGSPWVPNLPRWAFYGQPGKLEEKFAAIPDDVDVLVTHGPPQGILDHIPGACLIGRGGPDEVEGDDGLHVGSAALAKKVQQLAKVRLHIFGHIHEAYGKAMFRDWGAVDFVNAAVCNEHYQAVNKPIVVEV